MKVTVNMSDDISYLNMGCSIYEGCSNIQIEKMLLNLKSFFKGENQHN